MPSEPPPPASAPAAGHWMPAAAVGCVLAASAAATIATVAPVHAVAGRGPVSGAHLSAPRAAPTHPSVDGAAPTAVAPCRDRAGVCAPLATFGWAPSRIPGHRVPAWTPTGHSKPVPLQEAQAAALPGMASPTHSDFSPPPLATSAPMWLSLAAAWCQPCKAELGDVVQATATLRRTLPGAAATKLVFVMADTGAGYSLQRARTELLADHARLRPDQAPLVLPAWAQFRSDLQNRWPPVVARIAGRPADALALPVNAVFDGCGNLWDWHTGVLDPAITARFVQRLRLAQRMQALGRLPCAALASAALPLPASATQDTP